MGSTMKNKIHTIEVQNKETQSVEKIIKKIRENKIIYIKNTSKNSLIYDLTVQGCQWMPIGMIEKRLKKDLSENLIAVDRQAKS